MQEDELKRLIDYAVYAPVGIVISVAEALPKAVETGRAVIESRTAMAKFIGKMAVDFAGAQAKSQVDDLRKQVTSTVSSLLPEPWGDLAKFIFGDSEPDSTSSGVPEAAHLPNERDLPDPTQAIPNNKTADEALNDEAAADPKINVDTVESVIPNYATLSATQIVKKLDLLSTGELTLVVEFERGHRGRKTIIAKAETLMGLSS